METLAQKILRKYVNKKHNPEDTFYSQKDCLKGYGRISFESHQINL